MRWRRQGTIYDFLSFPFSWAGGRACKESNLSQRHEMRKKCSGIYDGACAFIEFNQFSIALPPLSTRVCFVLMDGSGRKWWQRKPYNIFFLLNEKCLYLKLKAFKEDLMGIDTRCMWDFITNFSWKCFKWDEIKLFGRSFIDIWSFKWL